MHDGPAGPSLPPEFAGFDESGETITPVGGLIPDRSDGCTGSRAVHEFFNEVRAHETNALDIGGGPGRDSGRRCGAITGAGSAA